jgi:hypothetical protein
MVQTTLHQLYLVTHVLIPSNSCVVVDNLYQIITITKTLKSKVKIGSKRLSITLD